MIDLAIITGSSLANLSALDTLRKVDASTPYGETSSSIVIGQLASHAQQVAFLNRHGKQGQIPPHKINYRANIDALAALGVKNILAVHAVGGIADFAGPLHLSIPEQVIDYTYNREHSFYDGQQDVVDYIDFTEPFSKELRQAMIEHAQSLALNKTQAGFSDTTCYACTQGPRLESASEIKKLARDGCDLVGMTLMPESALAREKGMNYASLCCVVNWAAGLTPQETHIEEIRANITQASTILEHYLESFVSEWSGF